MLCLLFLCAPGQIPKDAVVEIWKGLPPAYAQELSSITKAGHRALLSAPWYINHIRYGQDWRDSYMVKPLNFSGVWSGRAVSAEYTGMLIGTEVLL